MSEETQARKGINARKKGARNERKIAQLFEDWTGYEFARTPGSGGLRWKSRTDVVGDIVCTEESHAYKFPFTIEAKFHGEIDFSKLIGDRKSEIYQFWEQASRDGKRANKAPLLFMRYNQMKKGVHFVGLELSLVLALESKLKIKIGDTYGRLLVDNKGLSLILMDSRDWFILDYSEVRRIVRSYIKEVNNGTRG